MARRHGFVRPEAACAGALPCGVNCLHGCANAAQASVNNTHPGSRPCVRSTDFIEAMRRHKEV